MDIHHIHLEAIDSTNNYLLNYHQEGEEVTFVWTKAQTAGRGCGNNRWECQDGMNIAFSVLFHPVHVPASQQFIISMANALALKEALDSFVDGITIKWPNDIYWHDYKMAGTLIEPSLRKGVVADCVIGTGINVNQTIFLSDAPNPVSLKQACGYEVPCETVENRVTECFLRYLEKLGDTASWQSLRKAYREALYRREGIHRYEMANGRQFDASLHTVEDDGTLVLEEQMANGDACLRRFAFKEVKFCLNQKK